ncbi:serine/threonine-protein kinase [Nonomuraea indica]|uniref:non-specific serine/threonine protein kinase n=1 Tax=Nonomuraea indica TaxID=1581193 RepID=A0ABW8A614_9ACTN
MRAEPYLLAGRYLLTERLGEGGAGTVWRAVDRVLDRQVAVKQVRVPAGLTPQERTAFTGRAIHEARSAGRLRDPAIVLVHDVVLDGDQPWIIMDLVTGRSLDKVIKADGPLPPHEVARIGLRVLSALETAHMHGILHHDVKPANILLDADGSAMLTDFGIAVPLYGQDGGGPAGGSLGYMAPERLNQQAAGPASDLWSLGAALYAAAEGRAPFERPMAAAVAAAVLLHAPPYPERAGRVLGDLIMAMLAKDPAERPPAASVRERLAAVAEPGRRRRRRWLAPVAVAAAVLVGAGGWYGVAALRGGPDPGRFVTAPDPCRLLSDAQAAELLDGRVRRVVPMPGTCEWKLADEPHRSRRIVVGVRAERPNGDLGGAAVAERRFAGERVARSGAQGKVLGTVTGPVHDVQGVGEKAFAQVTFRLATSSTEVGQADNVVLFRLSNLLGEVVLHHTDVPVDEAGAGRATAVDAARLVSAAIGQ